MWGNWALGPIVEGSKKCTSVNPGHLFTTGMEDPCTLILDHLMLNECRLDLKMVISGERVLLEVAKARTK